MAALAGQPGATRDCLVYGAALCLWHLGRQGDLSSAAEAVRSALDRGQALEAPASGNLMSTFATPMRAPRPPRHNFA